MEQEIYLQLKTKFGRDAAKIIVFLLNRIELYRGKNVAGEDLERAFKSFRGKKCEKK